MAGGNLGEQFSFQDQADLRYARTLHLECYFANSLQVSFPEKVPVIPDALANKCVLVLETNDPDDITKSKGAAGSFTSTTQTQKWLPLTALNRVQSTNIGANAPFVRQLMTYKDLYITWQKSFLQLAPGGFGNTTDLALVLGVWYTFLTEQGKPINRTRGGTTM